MAHDSKAHLARRRGGVNAGVVARRPKRMTLGNALMRRRRMGKPMPLHMAMMKRR